VLFQCCRTGEQCVLLLLYPVQQHRLKCNELGLNR
jgi:hypothetical protein